MAKAGKKSTASEWMFLADAVALGAKGCGGSSTPAKQRLLAVLSARKKPPMPWTCKRIEAEVSETHPHPWASKPTEPFLGDATFWRESPDSDPGVRLIINWDESWAESHGWTGINMSFVIRAYGIMLPRAWV